MKTPLVSALNALREKSKLPPAEIVGVLSTVGIDVIWNGEANTFEAPQERIAVSEAIALELRGHAEHCEIMAGNRFTNCVEIDAAHAFADLARAYRMAANFLTGEGELLH